MLSSLLPKGIDQVKRTCPVETLAFFSKRKELGLPSIGAIWAC